MKQTERDAIAIAYATAWKAVKKSDCTVIAKPNGWFEVVHHSYHLNHRDNRRTDALLQGLFVLVTRLSEKVNA